MRIKGKKEGVIMEIEKETKQQISTYYILIGVGIVLILLSSLGNNENGPSRFLFLMGIIVMFIITIGIMMTGINIIYGRIQKLEHKLDYLVHKYENKDNQRTEDQ
jgi:hypothetical protein